MEKLFIRLVLALFFCQFSFGQDTLYVYKTKGTSLVELNKKQITLKKGYAIDRSSIVKVLPNASFTSIDNVGNVYYVDIKGAYNLGGLLNFRKKKNSSSLTRTYFKHIWNELMQNNNTDVLIGGVFRGEVLMKYPIDSSKVASSKIAFKWQIDEETKFYYVFIKNIITDKIFKIEIQGSQLSLYDDNSVFSDSDRFEWSVSTDEFPNLDNIPFYSFQLIDRNNYESQVLKYNSFIQDLVSIGTTDFEIETILCETYGLCK